MASTSAISGLVSGLDTKTIISQLMSIAKAPQDALKTDLNVANAQTTAAQAINSKAASMTSVAKDLASASVYTTASASSTDSSVSAAASASATNGSITFTVKQLATAHVVLSDAIATGSGAPAPAISIGGSSYAADSVSALAEKINKATDATVTATVVNDGSSQRLQLTAKTTGVANTFSVSGTGFTDSSGDPVSTTVTQGQNAQIAIGDSASGNGAVTISSASNTFKGLMAGVDVTVSAKDKTATVSTAVNQGTITGKVNTLVTAMNNVLGDVAFHTKALATGTAASSINGGLLRGNSTMRDLSAQVLNSISGGVAGSSTNATLAGLTVNRDGTVAFDASVFGKLYAKDPAQAQAVLQQFAGAVQKAGDLASNSTTGTVTSYISGNQSSVKNLTSSIANWDDRLAAKQKRLEAQYNALEVALGKLSSQSDSLTASLKQLSGNSN